jgi:hypothetical protein
LLARMPYWGRPEQPWWISKYPAVTVPTCKLVFRNEFAQNVCDFDGDIIWVGHRGIKIEVFSGPWSCEACPFPRLEAVEQDLDKFKRGGVGINVPWVAYAISPNGDAGAIGVIFFRMNFTYLHCVAYFLPFVGQYVYVVIVYEKKGVSATHPQGAWGITRADVLAETPEFIGVQGIPGGFVAGVLMELLMFKKFSSGKVEHQKDQRTAHQC